MNALKILGVLVALAIGLSACAKIESTTAPTLSSPSKAESIRGTVYVGALVLEQTMRADQIADEYRRQSKFDALLKCYQAGRCAGVDGEEVTIFLRYNRQRLKGSERRVMLQDGVARTAYDGRFIRPDTGVCIEAPEYWGAISRQERIPEGETRAVCTGDVYPYFAAGNGRHADDAYGVSALKPRNVGEKGVPTS